EPVHEGHRLRRVRAAAPAGRDGRVDPPDHGADPDPQLAKGAVRLLTANPGTPLPGPPRDVSRTTGLILQPTYRAERGRAVVQLFGRLEGGAPFLVEDDRFRPYFFVHTSRLDAVKGEPGVSIEVQGLRDLDGRGVARVLVPVPAAVPNLRDRLAREE